MPPQPSEEQVQFQKGKALRFSESTNGSMI